MSKYVNVYLVQQGYGGPEEGGWWYDYGVPHVSIPCGEWGGPDTDADALFLKWSAWCDAENEQNPHYTNTNGVGEYRAHLQERPAKAWHRSTPR